MASALYDVITIGGGIAGAALAKSLAERGVKVLVLERERAFKDRVRGEAIMPWGTAEAKALGIYGHIMDAGGRDLPLWNGYVNGGRRSQRDLTATTTPKEGVTAFYHPQAQEALIQAAAGAGAEVRRGAEVKGVNPSAMPEVLVEIDGLETVIPGRLIVGSDGKDSKVRTWAGFDVLRDPDRNLIAGILIDDIKVEDQASHAGLNTDLGLWVLTFPQGKERARGYVCYPRVNGRRLSGHTDFPRFTADSIRAGMPAEHYAGVKAAGPLATFGGAARWVEHPYRNGVALIGAAAADPDPTWGQGMSVSLRDARVLRDHLLANDDWELSGQAYAAEHAQYYGVIHTAELWQTQLLLETGPEADARRERAFAAWREDRSRSLDVMFSGPGPSLDETARRRYFGED